MIGVKLIFDLVEMSGRGKSSILPAWMTEGDSSNNSVVFLIVVVMCRLHSLFHMVEKMLLLPNRVLDFQMINTTRWAKRLSSTFSTLFLIE